MQDRSAPILSRLSALHPKNIDLSLRGAYSQLLSALGHPEKKLPPIIHVAGTNGKGSTIAFMRAVLEASGRRVHAYTSPHLVMFHERIRLAGKLIDDDALCDVLLTCEKANAGAPVTFFEITTAAAFLAFSRAPADILLLETGLGGRLDATNVIEAPIATIITRISYDHREFLGDTLEAITAEKAGILKKNIPAIIAPQKEAVVLRVLEKKAAEIGAPFLPCSMSDAEQIKSAFPVLSLTGAHQYINAAMAIATLKELKQFSIPESAISTGLQKAEWPARLQRLTTGAMANTLPAGSELWLDGGHNDSAGEVLSVKAADWQKQDKMPLMIILGMLGTKNPQEFLAPLAPYIHALAAIPIPGEPHCQPPMALCAAAASLGIASKPYENAAQALAALSATQGPVRVLITGSLYLAGHILKENALSADIY